MRPKTIVYFECIILGTILLGALQSYLSWDQAIEVAATVYRNSAIAFNLTIQIFSFVLPGTLALLVSRRRSKTAMWVLIALLAPIGYLGLVRITNGLLGSDDIIPFTMTALEFTGQVVAYSLLFTPSARRWMNREEDQKEREAA